MFTARHDAPNTPTISYLNIKQHLRRLHALHMTSIIYIRKFTGPPTAVISCQVYWLHLLMFTGLDPDTKCLVARELPHLADLRIAPFETLSLGEHGYPKRRAGGVGEAVPGAEVEIPAIYVILAEIHRLRAGLALGSVLQN
ncbi:hypothetical protein G6011_08216 [Alternaria panax]|uniref:Uncharacterized protein n=1 Tax=Alternaria panax TaxID=48097 RepID=A0AAD4FJK1_9PLEO|nr:hypothetical protein G6011_08216 [Alternaria panax]